MMRQMRRVILPLSNPHFDISSEAQIHVSLLLQATGFSLFFLSVGLAAADEGSTTLSLELGKIFTFFFLTLGPASVIAPFARSTAALDGKTRRRVAFAATGIALFSILVAATVGVRVLTSWGISTGALLIAAGIFLFLVALESIRSQYRPTDNNVLAPSAPTAIRQLAFQLAFPYLVSPYGIAIVILVLTTKPNPISSIPIIVMLVGIMLLNTGGMLIAHRIARSTFIAPTMMIVASVLAVLQAALGIQAILSGLKLAG